MELEMTITSPDSPAFTLVPVPVEHVPAVYRYLAELATPPLAPADAELRWTDDELRKLLTSTNKTVGILIEMMDFLAESPDTYFTPTEVAESIGREPSQIQTIGTHMTRHFRAHYNTTRWIFESAPGKDIDREGSIYYRLTAALAEQWMRVRAA